MREGKPSLTALAVAVGRGIGTNATNFDRSAADLVPAPWGRALEWIGRPGTPGVVRSALRFASLGMVDHVSLRRAAIDAELFEAIDAGATQLVVLGAGLDGRAWRLDALSHATVFEVDHPSTQAGKRARVEGRATRAARVCFVPVDFERDSLAERLREAGHRSTERTAWIWEGVTPYLHPDAIEATLRDVSALSAAGSRLLVSYAVPRFARSSVLVQLIHAGFSVLGEPLHGAVDSDAFAKLLARHRFVVREDSDNRQWARLHQGSSTYASAFAAERLVTAEAVHPAED